MDWGIVIVVVVVVVVVVVILVLVLVLVLIINILIIAVPKPRPPIPSIPKKIPTLRNTRPCRHRAPHLPPALALATLPRVLTVYTAKALHSRHPRRR